MRVVLEGGKLAGLIKDVNSSCLKMIIPVLPKNFGAYWVEMSDPMMKAHELGFTQIIYVLTEKVNLVEGLLTRVMILDKEASDANRYP
jgi:hypothetical protein